MKMDLTTAIVEDIVKVDHCYKDDADYKIDAPIALTLKQLIVMEERFSFEYYDIKKANNWGTVHAFDVVIQWCHFRITASDEPEFLRLLNNLRDAVYPTENNFDYFIDKDWI